MEKYEKPAELKDYVTIDGKVNISV